MKFRPGKQVYHYVSFTEQMKEFGQVRPNSARDEFSLAQLDVLDSVSGLVLASVRRVCIQTWEQLREDQPHSHW